jgi:UDP-N-acetylmuramyl pentapeptide phosphotransferase/UDP-N-acetylglucosamine-1-phosphate transferase
MLPSSLDIRQRSLLRGTVLVLGSLLASLLLAHWPDDPPSLKLLAPTIFAFLGTWDTLRCLRARWSFYHGAVMILLYVDVMVISMILFLFLYPWGNWIK